MITRSVSAEPPRPTAGSPSAGSPSALIDGARSMMHPCSQLDASRGRARRRGLSPGWGLARTGTQPGVGTKPGMGTKPGVRSLCHDALVNRGTGRIATVTALAIGLPAAALADPGGRRGAADGAGAGRRRHPVGADHRYTDERGDAARLPRRLDRVPGAPRLHGPGSTAPSTRSSSQLLRNLAPGQAPVLRIGGDSTDATWWPMRGVIPPGGINYGLTKGWMRTTQALAASLSAQLILGINMATGRPALAAAEARALLQGIGRRYISAFELGNEPDIYNIFAWYRDRRGRVVYSRPRSYRLSGLISGLLPPARGAAEGPARRPGVREPGLGAAVWARFIAPSSDCRTVTFHRYPLRGCTTAPHRPRLPLDPQPAGRPVLGRARRAIAPYVAVAHQHGLPFRLDELNSASCRAGRASATRSPRPCGCSTRCSTLPPSRRRRRQHPHAPGRRLRAVHLHAHGRQLAGIRAPRVLRHADVRPGVPARAPGCCGISAPAGPVKVWATARRASARRRVVLINKDPSTAGPGAAPAARPPHRRRRSRCSPPSLAATSAVTLGGQTFGPLDHHRPAAAAHRSPRRSSPVARHLHGRAPARQRAAARRARARHSDAGLVQLAIHVAGELPRQARDRLELLAAGGEDRVRASRSAAAARACAPARRRAARRGSTPSSPGRGGSGGG